MCAPSTSASVIITILWYLSFERSISSPNPAPNAVIIALISAFSRALFIPDFSTFSIFPLRGSIAWNLLSLPCFAEPPAEFPSTMNISDSEGSFEEQSASFPGNDPTSRLFFLSTSSLAFFAASLAFLDIDIFSIIFSASFGWSSK